MAAKFTPGSDRILVTVVDQERILDGYLMPDTTREDMRAGVVLAKGPKVEQWAEGDRILFGPHAGMPIQVEGVPFLVMKEGEVIGKVVE